VCPANLLCVKFQSDSKKCSQKVPYNFGKAKTVLIDLSWEMTIQNFKIVWEKLAQV
jgi:hypothetical protein